MARYVTYQCPECGGKFEYMHHPSDDPGPDTCALCQHRFDELPDTSIPTRLNIGTDRQKVPDQIYRQMEEASENRTHLAAEMTPGASASDFADLKITDMSDNTKEGETSAKSFDTRAKQAEKNLGMFQSAPQMQGAEAAAWADHTRSGPEALGTRRFMDATYSKAKSVGDNETLAARATKVA